MSMISSYFSYQNQYVVKYGPKTIVFMEVGSFFEIYGAENQEGGQIIHTIARLLNLHVSKKNGKNKKNSPYMAGFPNYTLDKYIKILLTADFTIVIIEQEKVDGLKRPERKVTRIISPGTDVEHVRSFHSNRLVSLYIEIGRQVHGTRRLFFCGLTTIDVTTGKSTCSEFCIPYKKIEFALAQLSERLYSINPNEIIWSTPKQCDADDGDYAKLKLTLRKRECLVHRLEAMLDLSMQQNILEEIFPNHGMLSVFQYTGLSTHAHMRASYVQLISFVQTHSTIVLKGISKPTFLSYTNQCVLTSTTLDQLKIINPRNKKNVSEPSLFQIINKCSTAVGKRNLFHRLTHPIYELTELEKRYDGINQFLQTVEGCERSERSSERSGEGRNEKRMLWENVEGYLDKIVDIERLHRRMQMKKIRPSEFASFWVSYTHVHSLIQYFVDSSVIQALNNTPDRVRLKQFLDDLNNTLQLEKVAQHTFDTIDETIFVTGVYPLIDSLQAEYLHKKEKLEQWRQEYSDLIDPTKPSVRLVSTDRDGTYLSLTKKRYSVLQEKMSSIKADDNAPELELSSLQVIKGKHDIKLKGGVLRKNSDECSRLLVKIRTDVGEHFTKYMSYLCEQYDDIFHAVSDFVAEIDVMKCGAKVAMTHGYCRPTLDTSSNSKSSYVQFTGIRHPIIERIQDDVPYITNDIHLGKNVETDTAQGILLYGVNAAGKSSLMKAVGVNLIMAQAGLYVAAQSLKFSPYRQIFTRLTKEDNLYEGLSSFAVEMTELRSILIRANEFSLVLGDELCSGTESISALAIVSAGIQQLHQCGATYFFATHLHKLDEIPLLNELTQLKKFHLSVSFEPSSGLLRYDRKLSPGIGSSLYGLEVCKGMDMPEQFMNIASSIRESVCTDKRTKSLYNAKSIKCKCNICGERADDTHHIQFQKEATERNMIGHIHKNRKSNLVQLCETCHHAVHHGTLMIHGYVQTLNGRKLEYEWLSEKEEDKKKFSQEHIDWIFSKHASKINSHVLKQLFESTFGMKISKSSLSKIRNGKY